MVIFVLNNEIVQRPLNNVRLSGEFSVHICRSIQLSQSPSSWMICGSYFLMLAFRAAKIIYVCIMAYEFHGE